MSETAPYPLVGIPSDVKTVAPHPFHMVGEKYIDAVARGAGCLPVILPALGPGEDLGDLRDRFDPAEIVRGLDGLFLPGSYSDVAPDEYGVPDVHPETSVDRQRDATTLPLIRSAIAGGVPVLAVCRGFQELNVALGGTLRQAVHEDAKLMDHREDATQPRNISYGPAHEVSIHEGGLLSTLLASRTATVNSLHRQGVDTLAPGLVVEATAPDGLIEAVSFRGANAFCLGVQWHPEWRWWEDSVSKDLLSGFGREVHRRYNARRAADI